MGGAEDRRVGWVSLDRLDDDPSALLTLLASAYGQICRVSADLVADMTRARACRPWVGRRRGSPPRSGPVPVPFVLMLDDLHELRSPDCHDVLSVVVGASRTAPSWWPRAASSSRTCPGCGPRGTPWSSWPSDLALDAAGAEQIFAQAHVQITPELAAAVTVRTEGWPAGLYLAA